MTDKKPIELSLATTFVLAELVLGILVQTVGGVANRWLSFSCVVLSFLFAFVFFEKEWSYALTQLGLAFTVCADIFLVVMDPMQQLPAMMFFSVTQICYFLRLYFNHETEMKKRIHLILRIATIVIAIGATIAVLGTNTDALSLVSMFYYANLGVNVIVAFMQLKRCPTLAIGLLFFILCDTIIGLNVMADSYISGAKDSLLLKLINSGLNWAWVFYVPSQTLIALSLIKKTELK